MRGGGCGRERESLGRCRPCGRAGSPGGSDGVQKPYPGSTTDHPKTHQTLRERNDIGEVAKNFSTLSWPGKVADNPKPYGTFTESKGPLTEADLAEFELKMLKLIHEMA